MMKEKISGEPGTYAGQQQHNLKIARKVCTFLPDNANEIDNSFTHAPETAHSALLSTRGLSGHQSHIQFISRSPVRIPALPLSCRMKAWK
ncbi:hypothetical protein [Uliginosibacterium flavum]|uniref:Uncharacterized protein n=1 Tax=Uliginosibacterium flavum TaxID=1396831 RepID=A0ABV2TR12_9RHOO